MTLSGPGRGVGGRPVLVLRALGLGDTLTGLPALRALRRHVGPRPVVVAAPEVYGRWMVRCGAADDVVVCDSLDGPPPGRDLGAHDAVDLHGNGPASRDLLAASGPDDLLAFASDDEPLWRADEHEVRRWCRLVGAVGATARPEDLYLDPNAHGPAERTASLDGPVLVHPGAAAASRRWPADRWVAVIRALHDEGRRVVLTGGPGERDLCTGIGDAAGVPPGDRFAGRLDLDGLTRVVGGSSLVLCGDTGVAHVATALAVRSVLLFGPTPPAEWGPAIDAPLHTVLWHGTGRGDPHGSTPDPALLRIDVAEVLDAARAQLAETIGR